MLARRFGLHSSRCSVGGDKQPPAGVGLISFFDHVASNHYLILVQKRRFRSFSLNREQKKEKSEINIKDCVVS